MFRAIKDFFFPKTEAEKKAIILENFIKNAKRLNDGIEDRDLRYKIGHDLIETFKAHNVFLIKALQCYTDSLQKQEQIEKLNDQFFLIENCVKAKIPEVKMSSSSPLAQHIQGSVQRGISRGIQNGLQINKILEIFNKANI